MQWRLSFSVAERTLVWSFNHTQMQCYALMKILLKEYINIRCHPEHKVLCSYFIKTFLFWIFEKTDPHFWRSDNIRECINYLIVEFSQCIREGELKHYFFPRFNLLSIKLTRETQRELLQLFKNIIQYDIAIFRECRTLRNVWSELTRAYENMNSMITNIKINYRIKSDNCLMYMALRSFNSAAKAFRDTSSFPGLIEKYLTRLQTLRLKSSMVFLLLRLLIFHVRYGSQHNPRNRDVYNMHQLANNDISSSVDISTYKLWYGLMLLKKGDHLSCLRTVQDTLSSIPPYAMYFSRDSIRSNYDAKRLYGQKYFDSKDNIFVRVQSAWLWDLFFLGDSYEKMPLAIQVELRFCDAYIGVFVSPFTLAYYLMFLCYHELHQYEERDNALRLLVDVVNSPEQYGDLRYRSYNIAGHCLLLAGKRDIARDMFINSFQDARRRPGHGQFNSAHHYLQIFFQNY